MLSRLQVLVRLIERNILPFIKVYPYEFDDLVFDINFTPVWVVDCLSTREANREDDDILEQGNHYYQNIFDDLASFTDVEYIVNYLCDSSNVGDSPQCEYTYYYGRLFGKHNAKGVPFIYLMPSSESESPSRVILYSMFVEIDVTASSTKIELYLPTNTTRNIFFSRDEETVKSKLIYFLKNTDRRIRY